jgi:hypothetical protein
VRRSQKIGISTIIGCAKPKSQETVLGQPRTHLFSMHDEKERLSWVDHGRRVSWRPQCDLSPSQIDQVASLLLLTITTIKMEALQLRWPSRSALLKYRRAALVDAVVVDAKCLDCRSSVGGAGPSNLHVWSPPYRYLPLLLKTGGIEAFRPPDQAGSTDSASFSITDAAAVKHHDGGAALAEPQASSERQEHHHST